MLVAAVDWVKWSAIGSLAAAVATLLVALVTLGLVIVTRGMVSAAKKGLEDDWSREWAAQRPVVYPLASAEWTKGEIPRKTLLPLKNGGRGPALNVTGTILAESGDKQYERAIIGGTIAAGEILDARIEEPGIEDWSTARGILHYSDLATGDYEGRFSCSRGPGSELVLAVDDPGHTSSR